MPKTQRRKRTEKVSDAQYIAAARRLFEREGELEIDDAPRVSRGSDPGAYVAAWVWVPNEAVAKKCSRCGTPEETDGVYSNLAPYSGLCAKCIIGGQP